MRKTSIIAAMAGLLLSWQAFSDTSSPSTETQPTTRPAATAGDSDAMFRQLLSPVRNSAAPLQPVPDQPGVNAASAAVAPKGETQNLIREGTYIHDRTGRLARTADGQLEFRYESDGQAMQDPPMIVLPNLSLMQMEDAIKNTSSDLKFRITGMVTEYGSRNYILIYKVVSAESDVK